MTAGAAGARLHRRATAAFAGLGLSRSTTTPIACTVRSPNIRHAGASPRQARDAADRGSARRNDPVDGRRTRSHVVPRIPPPRTRWGADLDRRWRPVALSSGAARAAYAAKCSAMQFLPQLCPAARTRDARWGDTMAAGDGRPSPRLGATGTRRQLSAVRHPRNAGERNAHGAALKSSLRRCFRTASGATTHELDRHATHRAEEQFDPGPTRVELSDIACEPFFAPLKSSVMNDGRAAGGVTQVFQERRALDQQVATADHRHVGTIGPVKPGNAPQTSPGTCIGTELPYRRRLSKPMNFSGMAAHDGGALLTAHHRIPSRAGRCRRQR